MSKINKIKVKGEVYSINDLATQEALNSEVERAYTSEENIKKDFEGILAKVDDSFNRLNTLTQNSGEGSIQEQINKSIENKQDKLISGVNIKTVNGKSILGSGEVISDNSIGKNKFSVDVQNSLKKADTAIQDISGKQNKLISGNNIKTINGLSLMGSGNIDLETLSGSSSADIAPHSSTLKVESTENNTILTGNTIGGDEIAIDFPAATTEKAGVMSADDKKEQVKKTPLVNGDIIVGQTREIYSRQGKIDSATFLKRTTAGSTSVSDGVASVKQIGGNIVKNLVDLSDVIPANSVKTDYHNVSIFQRKNDDRFGFSILVNRVIGHQYYFKLLIKTPIADNIVFYLDSNTLKYLNKSNNDWVFESCILTCQNNTTYTSVNIGEPGSFKNDYALLSSVLLIDLTEMYGSGNEPTLEECDKIFGTMDALPQGLSIAEPTGLKSTGYNQWNPENVLVGKTITDNAIVDGDKNIAVVECLPCKIGAGENNGYIIGYGEGNDWSAEDIEVYFSPLNPMEVEGELYMHKLERDSSKSTYVPECKGYLLIVTPTTDKLCAHLLWSGDREFTDYEEYIESNVALPTIPEMSEWGLAGISTSDTMAQDTIDLDRMVYTKRIEKVDWNTANITYTTYGGIPVFMIHDTGCKITTEYAQSNAISDKYTQVKRASVNSTSMKSGEMMLNADIIFIYDTNYTSVDAFKQAMRGVMLYYELAEPEEYPIVTKTAPNYIGSDYGVEEFTGTKIPLAANILFYMRSLVGETRNFIDQLYINTQKSDVKEVANYITNGIEDNKQLATEAPNLALRALFVAAGAEYNDTSNDITKTAPWGETVTHKAGHYYLNGLGDITEEEMMDIYIYTMDKYSSTNLTNFCRKQNTTDKLVRTNLRNKNFYTGENNDVSLLCSGMNNNKIEVFCVNHTNITNNSNIGYLIENATSCKAVIGIIEIKIKNSYSLKNTPKLEYIKIKSLKDNMNIGESPLISLDSVLYMIQNASPTSAITITLHPDAYTRLAEDADIVAALEAQPLITLVSA